MDGMMLTEKSSVFILSVSENAVHLHRFKISIS